LVGFDLKDLKPKIVTDVPGPKSMELFQLREKFVPQGVFNVHQIFAESADGAFIRDVDGNVFIDFCSGIGVMNTGHSNARIISTIKEQAEKFTHTCFHVAPYELYIKLAIKLAEITPEGLDMAMFANSGAEAVENAVKIVRYYTKRQNIITFANAFHGRTLLAMTLTDKFRPYKLGFGPFAPGIYRMPYAYCFRCPFNMEYPSCGFGCVEYIRDRLKVELPPEETAALIVEPVQGEGGFIVPPRDYLRELRKLCDEFNLLMIVDEVQTGFGRTGKMFAVEHSSVKPDVMTLAKSMAAGMPLSAVIGRREIMNSPHVGGIGGTYGGNPIACAASLEAIEVIKENLKNADKIGEIMEKRCREIMDNIEYVGDVRALGAMVAVEFVKDRRSKEPYKDLSASIISSAARKGLLLMKAGVYDNVIRFLPPVTTPPEVVERAMDIFEESVRECSRR
jgi:4-aminobutyrate aminotransferase/(S)-3-amino-2-methylpropionate transaminase